MALFRIFDGKASSVQPVRFPSEAALQEVVDDNLETMTGVRKLDSHYHIPNGEIDTLGIDERNVPVVVEYKHGYDAGALTQALFYLEWVKQNKRTVEMLAREKLGPKTTVNWNAPPRVLVIAKEFNVRELAAVNQMVPLVELKRYDWYGDLFTLDDATPMRPPRQATSVGGRARAKDVELPTLEVTVSRALPQVEDLFWKLRDRILALGAGIREVPGREYIDYRKSSTFVGIGIQKRQLAVLIKMGERAVHDPRGVTSPAPWYGKLNTRFNLRPSDDLDYAMDLVGQAFDYVP